MEAWSILEIKVHEIKGLCPVYKKGDRIVVDDQGIVLEKNDALCTHALSTLLHYAMVLGHDFDLVRLGLTIEKDSKHVYLWC